jgi:intraflagellar transport protein 52
VLSVNYYHNDTQMFVQFISLRRFISIGGSILVLMGEGGESKADTNINFFLEEHGIMINSGMLCYNVKSHHLLSQIR